LSLLIRLLQRLRSVGVLHCVQITLSFSILNSLTRSTKRASTSMIQRRLRIGYNRAARIMDLMEEKGIVGPENGSSPREILVDLESL
jgi:hypothetical protein